MLAVNTANVLQQQSLLDPNTLKSELHFLHVHVYMYVFPTSEVTWAVLRANIVLLNSIDVSACDVTLMVCSELCFSLVCLDALAALEQDIVPDTPPVAASVEYRKSLALSLFYKVHTSSETLPHVYICCLLSPSVLLGVHCGSCFPESGNGCQPLREANLQRNPIL